MESKADRPLAELLADAVTGADPASAAQVLARLAGLSGRGWLRLDASARRPYWG